MENILIDNQLADIQQKLAFITEEIEKQKRQRKEFEELKSDLTLIAKDVFNTTVHELEDVAPFVKTGDFIHLVKKVLRNINSISDAITKFESAIDFMEDASPISKELFGDTLTKLDSLDRKGYFEVGKSLGKMMDSVVSNLSTEEVDKLSENVLIILDLVKMLAKTDFLKALKNAISKVENAEPGKVQKFSPWVAHRELSTPEMRQVFGYMLFFLKAVIEETKKV